MKHIKLLAILLCVSITFAGCQKAAPVEASDSTSHATSEAEYESNTSNTTSATKDKSVDPNLSINKTGLVIGTVVSITLYGTDDESIMDGVFNILNNIDKEFSLTIEGSELNKVNSTAKDGFVELSDDLYKVIKKSVEYSTLSDGEFDITIEPLVKLWGIGTETPKVPTSEELSTAISQIDYTHIVLEDHKVKFNSPETQLDLGGIAKGFAADKIVDYLKDNGIDRAIISLGGNVYALGSKAEDKDWRIGVQDPNDQRNEIVGTLSASNKSIVTSGLYERFFVEDGIRYHHILSTKTGYPVNNEVLGVSIVSEDSIDGDALSTISFIMGVDEGMKLIESLPNTDAVFITKDSKVYVTSGLKDNFKLTNDHYEIAN